MAGAPSAPASGSAASKSGDAVGSRAAADTGRAGGAGGATDFGIACATRAAGDHNQGELRQLLLESENFKR